VRRPHRPHVTLDIQIRIRHPQLLEIALPVDPQLNITTGQRQVTLVMCVLRQNKRNAMLEKKIKEEAISQQELVSLV
jgi:hypothetical protein